MLLDAEVDTGWRQDADPRRRSRRAGRSDGPFVLLSGHHDTWHYGVMDNGGANATMLEVARVCALARDQWWRGLRVAFWSGHSQGRYSGSAWYADTHWEELDRRAVAHVNVDSTGGRGNTVVSDTSASEELAALARGAGRPGRPGVLGAADGRAGDQSFWGIGVPSIFANMSEQPAGGDVNAMGAVIGAGTTRRGHGLVVAHPRRHGGQDRRRDPAPRHAHLPARRLAPARDSRASPRLRLRRARARRDARAAGARPATRSTSPSAWNGPAPSRTGWRSFSAPARRPRRRRERLAETLRRLSRALVPLAYTRGDRFAHDPALPQPPLPALADTALFDALDADGRRFLASRLVREANRSRTRSTRRSRCSRTRDGRPDHDRGRRRDRRLAGARLLTAGHDVRFVEANREHVEAMRSSGLRVTGPRR